jgi:hypothetical protein
LFIVSSPFQVYHDTGGFMMQRSFNLPDAQATFERGGKLSTKSSSSWLQVFKLFYL